MINYRKYSGILVCEFMLFFDMVLVFYFTPLCSERYSLFPFLFYLFYAVLLQYFNSFEIKTPAQVTLSMRSPAFVTPCTALLRRCVSEHFSVSSNHFDLFLSLCLLALLHSSLVFPTNI